MRTLQRKRGFLVVIKPRGLPLRTVVTTSAVGHASFRKLHAMDICVARLAFRRRSLEICIHQRHARIGRFVATPALGNLMGAAQRKPSPGMVEPREVIPRRCGMAGLAFHGFSIQPCPLHELLEVSLVRIDMATCASEIWPAVASCRFRFGIARGLVAIAASNRNVTSAEPKRRFVVPTQAECGG